METGIKRILEFSADAHIQRRTVAKDSPVFHHLTGAIAALAQVLELLTVLQKEEKSTLEPSPLRVATWLRELAEDGGPIAVMPGPLRKR
jgi:hypothetical protein